MKRVIEEPVTVEGTHGDTVTTHPAFGQISASRRHGGRLPLYGSDFVHNDTIAITIRTSELHRGLSRDWNFPKQELIEVVLSESQWATFVSSLNTGSGPCCTIEHVKGERLPALPNPEDRAKQYGSEFVETLGDAMARIVGAMDRISSSGLSAKKASDIMSELAMAKQEIEKNLPFVAKSFDENMEQTVEKAKQEIHGYINSHIARAGLAALQGSEKILLLDGEDDGRAA